MLHQIYNDCIELIKASGRLEESMQAQQLTATTTPSAAIEAMLALTNKIKKHPSLQSNKKEEWQGFCDCLEIAESLDLISQTNMFDDIKIAIQKEFFSLRLLQLIQLLHLPHQKYKKIRFLKQAKKL